MKKDILLKWIEALESGRYKFARGKLRSDKGYCALGVLCDISELTNWKIDEEDKEKTIYEYYGRTKYLPKEVADWAELKGKERGDMPAIVMSLFDQGLPVEAIVQHLKKAYKIDE